MVGKWHVTPITVTGPGGPFDGWPLGMVNAMGPFNLLPESLATKIARIDDIGDPDTHTNFPHGWAMAANTPVKRYKQITHGGGIRDPLIVSWPQGLPARHELRHPFCHVRDLAPPRRGAQLFEMFGPTAGKR